MKKLCSILMTSAVLLYAQSGVAAIKCWTNNEGYRECGNIVPPEYAQKETRTLNKRGLTTEIKQRAKSREEILQERQERSEREQAETEAKQKREVQAASDRVLLSTFLTPEDIIAARDRKIAVFDGYLELSQITMKIYVKSLSMSRARSPILSVWARRYPMLQSLRLNHYVSRLRLKRHLLVRRSWRRRS